MFLVFFLICFFCHGQLFNLLWKIEFSAMADQIILKNASAISAINKTNAMNGIDGNPDTYVSIEGRFWYIIDMTNWYIVNNIKLRSRHDCCGIETSYFRVDLIEEWDGINVVNGSKCTDYLEETIHNTEYMLFCINPLKIARYVLFYRTFNISYPFSFANIEIYGYKYKINLNFTLGCYSNSKIIFERNFLNPDHCTATCSIRDYEFAAFDGKQCMCTNQIGIKTNISDCDNSYEGKYIMAKRPYHFFYKTLFCNTINCDHFCKNKKYFIFGKCGKEGCDPGYKGESCDVRDCSVKNGNCGESKCIENKFLNFSLSYCVCNKGYITYLNNSCMDINECEGGVAKCPMDSTCIDLKGSYRCHKPIKEKLFITRTVESDKIIYMIFLFLFLLLLLILSLLFFIYISVSKKSNIVENYQS